MSENQPGKRICITGGPKVGKTSAAREYAGRSAVRHTDDLIGLFGTGNDAWSAESAEAARWLDAPGPWVIEGVAVPRALRKWLKAHPEGKPCDLVVWLDKPKTDRTPGQQAMAKACATVFREILPELVRRGVEVERPEVP